MIAVCDHVQECVPHWVCDGWDESMRAAPPPRWRESPPPAPRCGTKRRAAGLDAGRPAHTTGWGSAPGPRPTAPRPAAPAPQPEPRAVQNPGQRSQPARPAAPRAPAAYLRRLLAALVPAAQTTPVLPAALAGGPDSALSPVGWAPRPGHARWAHPRAGRGRRGGAQGPADTARARGAARPPAAQLGAPREHGRRRPRYPDRPDLPAA